MTPDLPEFWWRIEVDATGAVVKCDQFDDERIGGKRVTYVQARTRKEALRMAAREWHIRHKKHQSISAKRLADRRRAAGQCRRCDEAICEESSYLCKTHLGQHREAQRRHARGEATPRVPGDALKLKEQHLAAHRLRSRLGEQLPDLLAKYDELDGKHTVFRAWLEREIEAREVSGLRLVRTG